MIPPETIRLRELNRFGIFGSNHEAFAGDVDDEVRERGAGRAGSAAGRQARGMARARVRRRTAEIGIRMALGADQPRILRMILRQGSVLLAIGLVLGAALGLLLSAQLTQLLYNVQPWDVSVLATTFAVLVAAGLLASLVPARRAAAVDPLVALRSE